MGYFYGDLSYLSLLTLLFDKFLYQRCMAQGLTRIIDVAVGVIIEENHRTGLRHDTDFLHLLGTLMLQHPKVCWNIYLFAGLDILQQLSASHTLTVSTGATVSATCPFQTLHRIIAEAAAVHILTVFKDLQTLPHALHTHRGHAFAERHRDTAMRIKRTELLPFTLTLTGYINYNATGKLLLKLLCRTTLVFTSIISPSLFIQSCD